MKKNREFEEERENNAFKVETRELISYRNTDYTHTEKVFCLPLQIWVYMFSIQLP